MLLSRSDVTDTHVQPTDIYRTLWRYLILLGLLLLLLGLVCLFFGLWYFGFLFRLANLKKNLFIYIP